MPQDWFHGLRCGIDNCSSRRYVIGDDGFKYCSRGHQAEDQLVGDDEEFMGAAAKKTKRGATNEGENAPKYLQGREAVELFLQCYQLMLRKQAWWLIQHRKFPAEFETVIRDLWALRLNMLQNLLRDQDAGPRLFASRSPSRGPSHSSEPTSESNESNPRDSTSGAGVSRSRLSRSMRAPRLIDSLGILYVGILLLRLPVSIHDLMSWTLTPGFSFTRAVEDLPTDMKQRLPSTMLKAFESRIGAPDTGTIHFATINTATTYTSCFGLQIPEINYSMLLFRYMTSLALPIDVYKFTHRLAQLLELNFTMPEIERGVTRLATHPEVQLASLICIVVKLLYPFEAQRRQHVPSSEYGPTSLTLDWHEWQRVRQNTQISQSDEGISSQDHGGFVREGFLKDASNDADMLAVTQRDVLQMTTSETDNYLDWFVRTWLPLSGFDEQNPEASSADDFVKALWRMFPLKTNESQVSSAKADENLNDLRHDAEESFRTIQASLKPVALDTGDMSLPCRPGDGYVHYRHVKDLPETARNFFGAAAENAGLSLSQLIRAVFSIEMRLERKLKKRASGSDMEMSDTMTPSD